MWTVITRASSHHVTAPFSSFLEIACNIQLVSRFIPDSAPRRGNFPSSRKLREYDSWMLLWCSRDLYMTLRAVYSLTRRFFFGWLLSIGLGEGCKRHVKETVNGKSKRVNNRPLLTNINKRLKRLSRVILELRYAEYARSHTQYNQTWLRSISFRTRLKLIQS